MKSLSFFIITYCAIFVQAQNPSLRSLQIPLMEGGKPAFKGQFPYLALIAKIEDFFESNLTYFCTGSILQSTWVLTAKHCILDNMEEEYVIYVGPHESRKKYSIERTIKYDNYDGDIAMIKVQKIQFNELVQPIALCRKFIKENTDVITLGWDNSKTYFTQLNFLHVKTMTNEECVLGLPVGLREKITPNHICAYAKDSIGNCHEDTGMPVVKNGELIGMVTFNNPCSLYLPYVYVRIYMYIRWIDYITDTN